MDGLYICVEAGIDGQKTAACGAYYCQCVSCVNDCINDLFVGEAMGLLFPWCTINRILRRAQSQLCIKKQMATLRNTVTDAVHTVDIFTLSDILLKDNIGLWLKSYSSVWNTMSVDENIKYCSRMLRFVKPNNPLLKILLSCNIPTNKALNTIYPKTPLTHV